MTSGRVVLTTPRSYQFEAVQEVFKYFRLNTDGHPLVVAPTGSGKTHILGHLCAETHRQWPNENVLIITHTKNIISQDTKTIRKYVDPKLVGVYSAGLDRRQLRQFTVAGIQSIYKKAHLFTKYKLVIIDEAHLIPPSGEGRYRTFFKGVPEARVLGLTATPFRRGHGMLTDNHMFDKIIYDISIQKLIDAEHLAVLTTKATEYALNTKGIKSLGGDFSKADLSNKLDHRHITTAIVKELTKFKSLRKSWLIFAIDIEHCEHIVAELNSQGVTAAAVHSKLDIDSRDLLELFEAGHIQAVVSVEMLTTGFDAPNIDMLVLMRPTQSPVLHVQMLGRGMRTHLGKENCLVLDFAGNVSRLGPVDAVEIKQKKKGKGNGNGFTRVCPECNEIVHISKKNCPACGFTFPVAQKLTVVPQEGAILKKDAKRVESYKVTQVSYAVHKKAGKLPSLKATYACGLFTFFHEWIAFEHKGYPATKAAQWWVGRGGRPIPSTVSDAYYRQNELKQPTDILVEHFGKFPNIIGYTFK